MCALSLALPSLAAADGPQFTAWTEPVWLGPVVNSPQRDLMPALSPDGLSLYFNSERAGGQGGFDIWVSKRACKTCPWQTPVNLAVLNTPGGDGSVAFAPGGFLLFFISDRPGGFGGEDMWMTFRLNPHDDFDWRPPINLGPLVNTPDHEGGMFVRRREQDGHYSLYLGGPPGIRRAPANFFGFPLGPPEPVIELLPPVPTALEGAFVRADGLELILTSTRPGGVAPNVNADLWVSTRPSTRHPWSMPVNLGTPVNTQFADIGGGLSADGLTLVFAAAAARGGLGLQDFWMTTRERIDDDDDHDH
jgi:hypothetical protein